MTYIVYYPVAIHKDENSCYWVSVPDLPGCFSAGDTYDEALNNVKEAIFSYFELLAEDGKVVTKATTIEQWQHSPDYKGAAWAFVKVNLDC
nr:type II toxin-antitoxin system HicB family antitoxin [uncultured Desulfobacter sp.]